MRIKITLGAGLVLTAIAVFAVLQRSPLTIAASNGIQAASRLGFVQRAGTYCQPGQALPRDISAIRLSFAATTGPKIVLTVSSDSHLITSGTIGSGWYGSAVTVPVRPLPRAYSDITICAHFGVLIGGVAVLGESAGLAAPSASGFRAGRLSVVYLRPGDRSWWSRAGSVIDHMALGRAASGTWIVFPVVVLAAAAIVCASLALTRELS